MTNDNTRRRLFAVLDIEVISDREAFSKYASLGMPKAELRWPFKTVCSASVLTFSADEFGLFEFGHLDSF